MATTIYLCAGLPFDNGDAGKAGVSEAFMSAGLNPNDLPSTPVVVGSSRKRTSGAFQRQPFRNDPFKNTPLRNMTTSA